MPCETTHVPAPSSGLLLEALEGLEEAVGALDGLEENGRVLRQNHEELGGQDTKTHTSPQATANAEKRPWKQINREYVMTNS